ncbi:MAG TPA: hypothetical protein VGC42_27335, partial [Kofleriaceae bacterium]
MARRRSKDPADSRPGRPEPLELVDAAPQKWWPASVKGADATAALWHWIDQRRAYLRGWWTMDLIHEAIYEGRPLGRRTATMDFLRQQNAASSSLNMLQSMIDTVVARNGKRRAMPVIGCDDAEYTEKRYAQRASRTLRRKMGTPHVEIELPLMMRDAVIRGDGYVMP